MASLIQKINNYRIKISSCKKIYKPESHDFSCFNNTKLINLNTWDLLTNGKIIKYSLVYTNPYLINKSIVKKIHFTSTKNKIVKNLCEKIFLQNVNYLNEIDYNNLIGIVEKKNKYDKYLGIESTFLILWFMIMDSVHIQEKELFCDLIKYYYLKLILGSFDFNEIIDKISDKHIDKISDKHIDKISDKNLDINYLKFYQCFYLLAEEFNYKYIQYKFTQIKEKNIILNSNYFKINPQQILTNCDSQYKFIISDLTEQLETPNGHNILFIKSNKKIYYYDPDEQILSDVYRLKIFFNNLGYNFLNISNTHPIQTILDDSNCVFYCLGFTQYLNKNNVQINLEHLKVSVSKFENQILKKNIYKWVSRFVD